MTLMIMMKGGASWYVSTHEEDEPEVAINYVKGQIDRGEILKVWWFGPHGQRFSEWVYCDPTEIAFIRTEQDDG